MAEKPHIFSEMCKICPVDEFLEDLERMQEVYVRIVNIEDYVVKVKFQEEGASIDMIKGNLRYPAKIHVQQIPLNATVCLKWR